MEFPTTYRCLNQNEFESGEYKIVPIRYQDRMDIMTWRNEQMYHLRQATPLTPESQENYFRDVVSALFDQENPNQLLFSYLKNGKCIGYGGLVHINWIDRNAEISFIMNTELEKEEFEWHWTTFLKLITKVGFRSLDLKKLFTYAYNLRPHLYPVLEKNGFDLKTRLKDELEIEGNLIDILIHEKQNPSLLLQLRKVTRSDMNLVYKWSNDPFVRSQSFNQEPILYESHCIWFENKLKNSSSLLLLNEFKEEPSGLVRFEVEEDKTIIGIVVNKDHRGMGLASIMLKKSCRFYFKNFKQPVWAFIKDENHASKSSFLQAGFFYSHSEVINNVSAGVYKLEKL